MGETGINPVRILIWRGDDGLHNMEKYIKNMDKRVFRIQQYSGTADSSGTQ